MYVYIKDRNVFLIIPIVGGTEIATDNTCKTFKSLQKFTENVMQELNFMEDLLRLLGEDYSDILNEIVHLKELYSSTRNTGIFERVSTFGYNGASPILSSTNSMLLDVSIERDGFTKVENHTFSARDGVLGSALRDQISEIENVKNNIPSIEFFRNNLPDIKITETDTAVLQKCEDTWNKCNFPSNKWQDFSGALKERIALIKEYGEGTEFDKVQLSGALEDTWGITFLDEINFNSLAKDIFSTIADQARRDDKTSLLTQFFLATVNIYMKDLKGSCDDFGKSFDENSELSKQLAIVVKDSLEQGFNTEEEIINFLVKKQIIQTLSPEQITAIKKIFTRQYSMIKDSPHFDEFIVLPKNTDSPWFEYGGSLCLEFSYFCSNITELKDIQKNSHKDKYTELKRDSQNSLQFMNPTSNFNLDNIKINLDNNNIKNFLSLSESDYNQANLFIEKIARNIDFSNDYDKQVIQKLFFYALEYKNENLLKKTLKNGADPNIPNEDGWTPFHYAVFEGNLEIVNILLKAGANPSITNNRGDTALHLAMNKKGSLELVQALLKVGADPNITNQNGDTALYRAAQKGNIEMVKALLIANADPNITNERGDTALIWAARNRGIEIVKALLNANADPNITHQNGDTALIWAAKDGDIEIVKALLKANANPNITNQNGDTALSIAMDRDNTEIVEALLNAGANPNITNEYKDTALIWAAKIGNIEIVQALLNANADTDKPNQYREAPLICAAKNGKLEIVQALLHANANPNITGEFGDTPLQSATDYGNLEIAKTLIDSGANPNITDKDGWTPLHVAVFLGNLEIVNILLKAGANPSITNNSGDTVLHLAMNKRGSLELVQALLKVGANPNIKNQNGDTALHLATDYEKIGIVEALLNAGADHSITNQKGETALICAASHVDIEKVKALLKAKANPDITDKDGWTALQWAVRNGDIEIVKALLNANANPNITNQNGDTALNYAITTKNNELVEALIDAKPKLNTQDNNGQTPLHLACKCGNMKIIETIIKAIKGSAENIKPTNKNLSTLGIFSKDKEREDNNDKINSIINIKNNEGLTAIDCTMNPEVKELLTKEFFNSNIDTSRNSKQP